MTDKPPERRAAPRYPVDTRIFASIAGQTVRLLNISRSGVAIHGSGLPAGSEHLLEVNLDHRHVAIPVRILDCSGPEHLHASFVEPGPELQLAIDRYIADLS
ncbi:MAG: PilZ domain-containing protein [Gammaproteobacteria bacterium]|nr:PilZ domain-containing protein [Gammaproteobacteria bacterium]